MICACGALAHFVISGLRNPVMSEMNASDTYANLPAPADENEAYDHAVIDLTPEDEPDESIAEALRLIAEIETTRPVDESFLIWANEHISSDFTAVLVYELSVEREWREPFFDLFLARLCMCCGTAIQML